MRERAEAMLLIEDIVSKLSPDDQAMIAFDIYRKWGHVGSPPGKHVGVHLSEQVFADMFSRNGGDIGGRSRSSSPKGKNLEKQARAVEVLAFLNEKTGKSYRPVEENLRFIRARLSTCSVEDCKGVIARKTREWLNTEHARYLRPATLFNATKFEQYIGEQPRV